MYYFYPFLLILFSFLFFFSVKCILCKYKLSLEKPYQAFLSLLDDISRTSSLLSSPPVASSQLLYNVLLSVYFWYGQEQERHTHTHISEHFKIFFKMKKEKEKEKKPSMGVWV